jgi:hypothetical protein
MRRNERLFVVATGQSFSPALCLYRPVEMWWHTRRNKISSFARNGPSPFKSAGGRQFSGLLAAEVCASAVVMLDTPCSEVVWRVLATHCIRQFSPSLPLPCVNFCHHISTAVYKSNKTSQLNELNLIISTPLATFFDSLGITSRFIKTFTKISFSSFFLTF